MKGDGAPASYPAAVAVPFAPPRALGAAAEFLTLALLPPAFFALMAFLWRNMDASHTYNSDLVHPYLLLEDLYRNFFDTIWTWHHSPAFYAFPDWLLVAAVKALPVPAAWQPLLFAPLMMTLYCAAGGALAAAAGLSRPVPAAWLVAAALFLGGSSTAVFPDTPAGPWLFLRAGAPYIHTGAMLAYLVAAALLVSRLAGHGGKGREFWLGAVVFAASFSDLLFVVWFVAPAFVVALLHAWANAGEVRRRGLRQALAIAANAAVAMALDHWLHKVWSVVLDYSLPFPDGLAAAWREAQRIAAGGDILVLAAVAICVLAIGRATVLFARVLRRRSLTAAAEVELLLGGSAAAAIVAPLAAGLYTRPGGARYFYVLGIIAAVWTVLLVLRLAGASRGPRFALAAGGAVVAAGVALAMPATRAVPRIVAPPPLQICIEAAGRNTGIGDYWTAKNLMFASARRIHIVQFTPYITRFRWNYNERWFTERADDGTPARPDFVVVARLPQHDLTHRFGVPARVVACAGTEIWFYDRVLPVPP